MDIPETVEMSPVEASLVAYATERCAAERVEVVWLGLDPAKLAGGTARWEGDPCRSHPQLSLMWSTAQAPVRVTVRPRLAIWVEALTAPADIAAGLPVIGVAGSVALSDLVAGAWSGGEAVALEALTGGEPLTKANVAAPSDAVAGTLVTVRVRAGELEVRTEGRLLTDARVGERVQVHLSTTKTTARGKLVAPDTVEL